MSDDEAKYLTALGDAFLVAARMHRGNTTAEVYDALRDGMNDNYYTVGTMAGLAREATIEAVRDLVGRGYLGVDPGSVTVSLLHAGARWYMTDVLAMEPPELS